MKLIDIIPIGKNNKKTRQELMYQANIIDVNKFKNEIGKIKEKYIILYDNGYYLPASKEEYLEFISTQKTKIKYICKLIELAYKEMEEL